MTANKRLLLTATLLLLAGCAPRTETGLVLRGSVEDNLPASSIILGRVLDQQYDYIEPIDTLSVTTDGDFEMRSDTLPPALYALVPMTDESYNNSILYAFLEPGVNKITLGANPSRFLTIHAEGTDLAERYQAYADGMRRAANRQLLDSLENEFNRVRSLGDDEAMRQIKEKTDPYFYKSEEDRQAYIDSVMSSDLPTDLFGLYLFYTNRLPRLSLNTIDEINSVREELGHFDPATQESDMYRNAVAMLDHSSQSAVGVEAPEISGTTPEGERVSLSDLRGKYVLVDFWSSTCTWCRAETPNLRQVYETFAGDHFTVLGVSEDVEREPWLHAIREDDVTWPQILLDREAISPTNRVYNIRGIPQILLLDPEGKILHRDLRGDAIYEAVEAALQSTH